MTLSRDELARLERLRALFLDDGRGDRELADYWRDDEDLAAYDRVLAERIGWKWDAALAECRDRGFARADGHVVLDFGCGTGIAAARFAAWFGARQVRCFDRSARAAAFASRWVRRHVPQVTATPVDDVEHERPDVLLVSHVLGELDARGARVLHGLIERSERVIVVEPGNHRVARRLSALRDAMLGRFHVLAPCPHAQACPALADPTDWCHFFATPPAAAFTDGERVRAFRAVGIDARALPYSFVALQRSPVPEPDPAHRLLGRPETDRNASRVRLCTTGGIATVELSRRDEPQTWRTLRKHPTALRTLPPR